MRFVPPCAAPPAPRVRTVIPAALPPCHAALPPCRAACHPALPPAHAAPPRGAGLATVGAPLYLGEIATTSVRGLFGSLNQLAVVVSIFFAQAL